MTEVQGATTSGAPAVEGSRAQKDAAERDQTEEAKKRAEFEAAPVKTFDDLPDDHPMKRRQNMLAEIEKVNENLDLTEDQRDAATKAAVALGDEASAANVDANKTTDTAPGIDAFRDKDTRQPDTTTSAQIKKQTAERTGEKIKIDLAHLDDYEVMTKVDGKEELVPASKVVASYQKSNAADVKLALASQTLKEAQAKADAVLKDAQQRASTATTGEKPTAQVKVKDAQTVRAKLAEAANALYQGETDKYAELQSEAWALMSPEPESRGTAAISDDLVGTITQSVKQQLDRESVIGKLFTDYPQIQKHRQFAEIADKYAGAFESTGLSYADAVAKAGDALAEEFGFTKAGTEQVAVAAHSRGRPVKTAEGTPTTREQKLSAKEELDNITSGNARVQQSTEAQEENSVNIIADIAARRPVAVWENRPRVQPGAPAAR